MPKALIAMSGGVDSSVAAWLMRERGYGCTGAMMKLYTNDDLGTDRESGCCSLADAEDARAVADRLGIPFYVFNFTDPFHQEVMNRFAEAYRRGTTPNPCIDCNRFVKFERFMRRAIELDMDCVVTGHYAQITRSGSRWLLQKGADPQKDQSYVLYAMTQDQLARTQLPLGELSKPQVREIAEQQGFAVARKRDSQDICFAPDGDYAAFIERHTGTPPVPGRFTDTHGNDLGEHRGLVHYTVGQRRGLGIAAEHPYYVVELRPETNTVVLGRNEELFTATLTARDINLIAAERIDAPQRLCAKIRYRHPEQPATVTQLDADTLRIEFDQPQRAVTKGQAVVLYEGQTVVGGGTIQ